MKTLILLGFIITISSAFSADVVVEQLKKENKTYKKLINNNNEIIKRRVESKNLMATDFTHNDVEDSVSGSSLTLGFERINWGADQNGSAPTLGYEYAFTDSWIAGISYGQFRNSNYPAAGTETLTHISHAFIKYNINLPKGYKIQPLVGYVNYIADSPDAGKTSDAYTNQLEEWMVEDIENRSGIFSGLSISKDISKNWQLMLRADISKSTGLHLNYLL